MTLASLSWDQLDLAKGVITIAKPGKPGNAVAVPLHPDLQAHLQALAGKDTLEEYVMPSLAGLESGEKRGLSRQFHHLMQDAGVDRREVTNSAGHKAASVHDLYTHFEREALKAAGHAIPSLPEL